MNGKKLLSLLLLTGFVALMIAGYVVYSAVSKRAKEESATVLFQATGIQQIMSDFAGEEQVFQKENDSWTYVPDTVFPLNPAYIEDMEDALLSLISTAEMPNGDPSEYGLAIPAFEISAIAEDGSKFHCAIGNENNSANVVYILVDENIYTVDIGFSRRFSHTLLEMVQKQPLLDLQPSEATALSIENGNGSCKLVRSSGSLPDGFDRITWIMGDGTPGDDEQAKSLILAIAGMRAVDCVAYKPDAATLSGCGFDQPAAVIGVSYNDTNWTAQIGNKTDDGKYYGFLPETGVICTFEASVPEQILGISAQDCRNRAVFPVSYENLTYAEVKFGGETKRLNFQEYGKAWDFYYKLSTMRAEQLDDSEPAGNADVTVTVYTTDSNVNYELAFQKVNEDFYRTDLFGYGQLVNKRDIEELLSILDK